MLWHINLSETDSLGKTGTSSFPKTSLLLKVKEDHMAKIVAFKGTEPGTPEEKRGEPIN